MLEMLISYYTVATSKVAMALCIKRAKRNVWSDKKMMKRMLLE